MGGDLVENIEVTPAAVDFLVAVHEIDLALGETCPFGLFHGIRFALIETGHGAQGVGVAPDIVGGGGIGAAEFRQLGGGPVGGFVDGGGGLGTRVGGVDQA